MLGHPFTSPLPPVDAPREVWLRRRIETLERLQQLRVELTEQAKSDMDATIVKAQLEITNLQAQLTIGVAR